MSNIDMAADVRGPFTGQIAVVATAASSDADDLSVTAELGTGMTSRFVRIIADVGIYYRWSDATGTADETATSGNNRVDFLPANTPREEKPAGAWLIHKATGTGKIRISIVNEKT